jgi:UDP-2,3-diacylglucosamine pyrophosphatase LpxH
MVRSKTYKRRLGGRRGPNNNNMYTSPRTLELLDNSDIDLLNGTNLINLPDKILQKLTNAQLILSKESWIIPTGICKDIYVTSDIHADLRKLIQLLLGLGLIIYNKPELYNINNILTIDPIPNDCITDMEWVSPNSTLLVIVGDVIDGKRAKDYYVFDNKGNIEVLLHAFLYNLRIKALQRGSEIRFTVGNHDNTSLRLPLTDIEFRLTNKFINDYVHSNALTFFGDFFNRRNCLLPFYKCCPYFIVSVGNEVIFVHGGIHSSIPIPEMIRLQETIQTNITNYENVQNTLEMEGDFSPLWIRYYAEKTSDIVCPMLKETLPYKLIVVGHCMTYNNFAHYNQILEKYTAFDSVGTIAGIKKNRCAGGGCVLIGCDENITEGPQLAFVDIGMSKAFGDNTTRLAEVLFLRHDEYSDSSVRYYNIIARIQANPNFRDDYNGPILEWASRPINQYPQLTNSRNNSWSNEQGMSIGPIRGGTHHKGSENIKSEYELTLNEAIQTKYDEISKVLSTKIPSDLNDNEKLKYLNNQQELIKSIEEYWNNEIYELQIKIKPTVPKKTLLKQLKRSVMNWLPEFHPERLTGDERFENAHRLQLWKEFWHHPLRSHIKNGGSKIRKTRKHYKKI